MGYKNREIELKLLVNGPTRMKDVDKWIAPGLRNYRRLIVGKSEDVYWIPPEGAKADFIRLRQANKDGSAKLTIKYTDKKNNFDRVEKDLEVGDFKQAYTMLVDIFGKPTGTINKRYIVYFMGGRGTDADTTISLYQIIGDKRVFLEVEAVNADKIDFWCKKLQCRLPYDTTKVTKSLFQIFVLKENQPGLPQYLQAL